jgi:hypothetical protein
MMPLMTDLERLIFKASHELDQYDGKPAMSEDSDYVEVEVWCSIGLIGCEIRETIEVERLEWEAMNDDQKEHYCREVAFESFEWGWEKKE